jgi:hypothetical protein
MGLKEVLSALKLVEVETPKAGRRPAEATPARRSAAPGDHEKDIEDILAEIPAARDIDERALPRPERGGAGALPVPEFGEIYRAAGIGEPRHGFSAHKVLEILEAPEFAGLEAKAKAAALSGFLKMNPGGPVAIADVIQDAVRRDQALDKFEAFLRQKLAERVRQLEAESAALQAEIDELERRNRAKMESNRRALDVERQRLDEWLARKRAEERRLAQAVAPFVEGSPITESAE